jgi:hypothetical protein
MVRKIKLTNPSKCKHILTSSMFSQCLRLKSPFQKHIRNSQGNQRHVSQKGPTILKPSPRA